MSGETEEKVSAWTVDSLKSHIEAMLYERDTRAAVMLSEREARMSERFDGQERALQIALSAQEKAVETAFVAQEKQVLAAFAAANEAVAKAEKATEKRFDDVAEFRAQLDQRTRDTMPRRETELLVDGVRLQVETLGGLVRDRDSRTGGLNAAWGYLIGAVGVIGGVIGIVIALGH